VAIPMSYESVGKTPRSGESPPAGPGQNNDVLRGVDTLARSADDRYLPSGANQVELHTVIREGRVEHTFYDVDGAVVRHATRYIESIRLSVAESSRLAYAQRLEAVMRSFRDNAQYPLLSMDAILEIVSRRNIEGYVEMERALALRCENTIHKRELAFKGILEWLATDRGGFARGGGDTPYPTGTLVSKEPHDRIPKALAEVQLRALLLALHNESERCAMHALTDAGLRISELCDLRNQSLPQAESPYGYNNMFVSGVKGSRGARKERMTLVTSPVLARIRRYHNSDAAYRSVYADPHHPNNLVFLTATGRPLTRKNVSNQLKAAALRADLDPSLSVHPHVLRHTFAAHILMSNDVGERYGDRRVVLQLALGHESLASGKNYARMMPIALVEAMETGFSKYELAKKLFDDTYKSPIKHTERRGHRIG
jgi:integrase/recombinase XerD